VRAIGLMIKVLWSPGEAFREIRDQGVGPWVPIIVMSLAAVGLTALLLTVADFGEMMLRQIQTSPNAGSMSASVS